jgi:hypothetical protein
MKTNKHLPLALLASLTISSTVAADIVYGTYTLADVDRSGVPAWSVSIAPVYWYEIDDVLYSTEGQVPEDRHSRTVWSLFAVSDTERRRVWADGPAPDGYFHFDPEFSNEAAHIRGVSDAGIVVGGLEIRGDGEAVSEVFTFDLYTGEFTILAHIPYVLDRSVPYRESNIRITHDGVIYIDENHPDFEHHFEPSLYVLSPELVPVSEVPVPAAAWLLGSGLISLYVTKRSKKI